MSNANVNEHDVTLELESGRTFYTLLENGEETDLLCRECECLYWQCSHAQVIVAEKEARRG